MVKTLFKILYQKFYWFNKKKKVHSVWSKERA